LVVIKTRSVHGK